MIDEPTCPVCGVKEWQELGNRTYQASSACSESPYISKRLEVLFDVWCAGAAQVTLTSILCGRCGFVCYSPRPTETDIERKYTFLAEDTATQHEIAQHLESDEQRSRDLFSHLSRYLKPGTRILDFGGGNGRLMRAFVDGSYKCYLVDFPGKKLSGINYLGSDLAKLDEGLNFDLIVASHVLEHLADPGQLVNTLKRRLTDHGLLYVEVPLEIWDGFPLPVEPVTHVNYFTVDSLRTLLQQSGYRVLKCREGTYTTEQGGTGMAIRAYAQRDHESRDAIIYKGSATATLQLVHPSLVKRAERALRYPRKAYQDLRVALLKRFGKTPVLWRLFRLLPRKI